MRAQVLLEQEDNEPEPEPELTDMHGALLLEQEDNEPEPESEPEPLPDSWKGGCWKCDFVHIGCCKCDFVHIGMSKETLHNYRAEIQTVLNILIH